MPTIQGGMGIVNPVVGEPGTLGVIALDTQGQQWIISCYHVLGRADGSPFQQDEPIALFPPLGVNDAPIGSVRRGDARLDVACAMVLKGTTTATGILGLPVLSSPIEPAVGMPVKKVGSATGTTEGVIADVVDGNVRIKIPDGKPLTYRICAGGDSGAVWICSTNWASVALHTGVNDAGMIPFAYGVSFIRALNALELAGLMR